MSEEPFEIEFDPKNCIMTAKVTGYWDLEAAHAFVARVRCATRQMRAKCGTFDMITDIGKASALPRDASDYLEREQFNARPADIRKMAYVCESVLGRLQLRRITVKDPNMAVFANDQDARAWLSERRQTTIQDIAFPS